MRVVYREQLEAFNKDLLAMADFAYSTMDRATQALMRADLRAAEDVLASTDAIDEIRDRAEVAAFRLLALQQPVAGELREVVSGIHIVEAFTRMTGLGVHVAKVTRHRHPEHAVPEPLRPMIQQMAELSLKVAEDLRHILETGDAERASALAEADDAVDELHARLFLQTTVEDWPFSTREAVDLTLISRYLERFSDHAVSIGERVVFMSTGMTKSEYSALRKSSLELDGSIYGDHR